MRLVAPQVFNLPVEYFKANYDRSRVPELQSLLKFDSTSGSVSKFVPVLYARESRGRRNDKLLFHASELGLVRDCLS
jgi:hypothetical protein